MESYTTWLCSQANTPASPVIRNFRMKNSSPLPRMDAQISDPELADAILITGDGSQPTGMVTVSAKEGHGEIGLIAVDAASRGKHCGEALVRAAQRWYEERGLKSAQVITQGDNLPACQLYRKCGYTIGRVEYFYHFWL
jgi:dTDP-4-amino-4,6-dideoxy-D-galactose acyltransferase